MIDCDLAGDANATPFQVVRRGEFRTVLAPDHRREILIRIGVAQVQEGRLPMGS